MVVVKFEDKDFYLDGRLKEQLDKKVIPDLQSADKDWVVIIDGEERSGKSVFGMQLGAYVSSQLNTPFDLSNVCMTPEEFRNKVTTSGKRQSVIYDEAHRGMGSRRALSEVNRILIDLMMEMGQKNLFIVIVLPYYFMLDKYAAIARAKGLFHIYEKRRKRFWCYFNRKNKLRLYLKGKKEYNYNCMKWPQFRGRFYNQYTLTEGDYRNKKAGSFKHDPKTARADKFMEQRDKILWALHKELGNLGSLKLNELLKQYKVVISAAHLREILAKFRKKKEKDDGED